MNIASSAYARLRRHRQKRLQRITPILPGILALIVLFPLAGCGTTESGAPQTATKAAPTAVVTLPTRQASVTTHADATPTEVMHAASIATTPTPTATAKATPKPMPTPTPLGQKPGWKLIWSDEFNGPSGTPPDASKWSPRVGGEGWGNEQLDYDTDNKNATQDGQGNLVLEADRGSSGYTCGYGSCQYTSAQITTTGHFSFTYGRIEGRIKIPSGEGLWSAFWMLGDNCDEIGWPDCGEIDIMEILARQPNLVNATIHGPSDEEIRGTYTTPKGSFADGYHIYALQWDPDHLYFSVDGITYYTINKDDIGSNWVYDHPFSILLNLPVGGVWPGTPPSDAPFPRQMLVDYVRVYTPS